LGALVPFGALDPPIYEEGRKAIDMYENTIGTDKSETDFYDIDSEQHSIPRSTESITNL